MKKKYAVYCSGGAGRIIKFFEKYNEKEYPLEFVYYDGRRQEISDKLFLLFKNKLIEHNSGTNPSENLHEYLLEKKIDYLFCFGDRILKGKILETYKNKIINFHPSLLPAFPGLNAIDQALASSVQILGNTAHFIDCGVDTGPIIMQSVLSRQAFTCYEDVLSLQIHMLERIWRLLDLELIHVNNNKVTISVSSLNQEFYSI